MKHLISIDHSVLAIVLLSAAVTAFAGGGGPIGPRDVPHAQVNTRAVPQAAAAGSSLAQAPSAAVNIQDSGKTRAQVRAELLQAQRAGMVPMQKNDYPPSATTIARNRARFEQIEQAWRSSGQMTASDQ